MSDFATESGHWYSQSGDPAYTITGANGLQRNTTVRDARKLGLVPSVTTVCGLEAKPQLTRWLVNQAMLAAITLPRDPHESDDQFMARALNDSQQQTRQAADRGTHIHGLIERAMRDGRVEGVTEEDAAIVQPVLEWLDKTFSGYHWYPERSFASELGFGGKIDLFGTYGDAAVVIDFKCKAGIAEKGKTAKDMAYDQHITQLAAYANGLGYPKAECVNLFIDADVPGCIVAKVWTADEVNQGWAAFECLLKLFKIRKGL
jgi:hypothetical protein